MNELPTLPASAPTVEDGVRSLIQDAKACACGKYEACENYVRKHPGKAMLIAAGAGMIAHRLPLRALFVTQARIIAALAPPAMIAFGAAKLCEVLQRQARR